MDIEIKEKRTDVKSRLETVDEVIASMPARFQPDACRRIKASYHWKISGKDPKQFTILVNDGTFEIRYGEHEGSDVIMDTDSDTYLGLVNGKTKGIIAIMTRKLRVRGSMILASKMDKIFV